MGGTSFAGITIEFLSGHQSIELAVGTWAARDLAVSVVGRQYFGGAGARPVGTPCRTGETHTEPSLCELTR